MGSIFRRKALLIILLFTAAFAKAQETRRPFFAERGGLAGAGYGANPLSLPEGKYIPVFFIARFGHDLIAPARLSRGQRLLLFFEPQVNAVVIQKHGTNARAAEFGLTCGVQYMYPLGRRVSVYALISSGPQYITVHTDRQAHGFIFSDNMGAGTYLFLSKRIALNTGFRIRHMSNANTRMPNHGINTINYLAGISYILR